MPRVPTYDNFTVQPASLPGARVETPRVNDAAAQQLEQTGQAAMRAGSTAATIATDVQNDVNRARVDDATTQAQKTLNDLTMSFVSLRGKDALAANTKQDYTGKLDQSLSDIRGSLSNDAQRLAFDHAAKSLQLDLSSKINAHLVEQQKLYDQQTQLGKQAVSAQTMGLNWNNPQAIEQGRQSIRDSVAVQYTGAPEEFVAGKTLEALTSAHAGVVGAAIEQKNYDYAKQYLQTYGAEIDTTARTRLEQAAKVGQTREVAQSFADDAMGRGLSMTDALAEARQEFSGEQEADAVAEVKMRFSERETARAIGQRDTKNAAWKEVMETGKLSPTMTTALREVDPAEEIKIRNYQQLQAKRNLFDATGKFRGDQELYVNLRMMALESPTDFVNKVDLRAVAPSFTSSQLEKLLDLQGSLSKGDAKRMQTEALVKTTVGSIRADMLAAGFKQTPKAGSNEAKQLEQFMGTLTQRLDDEIATRKADNKPPPTYDDLRRIGLSMVQEGVVQGSGIGGFFQTKVRGYEFATNPDYAGKNLVLKNFNDIPADVRNKLVDELGANVKRGVNGRVELSDSQRAEVERMYTRAVQTGRIK